jgi:TrmH family RNA methyltransferase
MKVILHHPEGALNIASTARVMANFGLTELRIVVTNREQGAELFTEEAKSLACHAQDILENSVRYLTLEDAIADCSVIVGFSGRTGKDRSYVSTLPELTKDLNALYDAAWRCNAALLFGNERYGLPNSVLKHCSCICSISTHPKQPSLNLSHAVAIALYQLQLENLSLDQTPEPSSPLPQQRVFQEIDNYLTEIGTLSEFIRPGGLSETPMRLLSRVFRRAVRTNDEAKAILGFLRRSAQTVRGVRY